MTLVDDPRPVPEAAPRQSWQRAWDLPVRAHLAALAVVLLALVPLVGTGSSFSADEGAAILQARSLADGGGWIVEHPLPEVDPDAVHYPLELSERGPDGTAPFAKHPLYALMLAGADRLGGVTAMVLLSLGGTLAAAALAGALAGHIDPALRRPAVWVTGLASPLLFDGYLVIAHTLGAACAAGAVLLAVRAIERGSVTAAIAVGPCVAAAVMLRTEAALFAVALAAVVGVTAVAAAAGRRARVPAVAVAVVALGAAYGARLAERVWANRVLGGPGSGTGGGPADNAGFLDDRIHSFVLTWLRPGYGAVSGVHVALAVMVVAILLGAIAVRRHPGDSGPLLLLGPAAAAAAVLALVIGPTNLVPGLLVAFPVCLAGLLCLRRPSLGPTAARVGFATFVLFALAVIATQYATGGSGEWGGRYFALALPVLVPVLLLALRDAGRSVASSSRRWAAASLVVCSVAMAAMGVGSIRSTHRFAADLMATVDGQGRLVGGRPVMVATSGAIPRLAWATFDDQRWLLSDPDELPGLVDRLRVAGISRFVLVTDQLDRGLSGLGASVETAKGRPDGRGWQILVLVTG